ncbi:MAG TPA: polysaccharide deacetylase family protein, partial [Nitrososphaerales archaeon]|nr:polysaccharide deacetylase family protein [Nitrososphaerales archaeon]
MTTTQTMKSFAVDTMMWPWPFSSSFSRKSILNLMKLGYEHTSNRQPKFPNGASAACTISLDFDHLTKSSESTEKRWLPLASEQRLAQNRIGTKSLLGLSQKYEIPLAWAICGATAEADFQSYESILRCGVKQEIGIHTYSHLDVSSCSKDELMFEIEKCLKLISPKNKPRTFIFPWNRQGHFETISELGFLTYRGQQRYIRRPKIDNDGDLVNISPVYYLDLKSLGASK